MTVHQFNSLSNDDKAEFTWQNTTHLANRVEDVCHTTSLDHYYPGELKKEFYIEIWYNVLDNCIDSIIGFDADGRLNVYLEAVKLNRL